jgi:hypothetical protein
MTGSMFLSALIGASASLLVAFVLKALYDVRSDRRKQAAFRSHEDEIWE